MLTIRLIKTGRKNNTNFRVVLIEKTAAPRSGKALEILGNYNPYSKEINLKEERIKYWMSQGAKASETVHNLLVRKEVIKGVKIKKNIKEKKKQIDSENESKSEGKEEVEKKEEAVIAEGKEAVVEKKEEVAEEKENKQENSKEE